jgi:iron complex outermembrane recepter protein
MRRVKVALMGLALSFLCALCLLTAAHAEGDAAQPLTLAPEGLQLAQGNQGASAPVSGSAANGPQANSDQRTLLQEVIVTAQKKTERALDVPVPMTVLDGQTLAENGQARLEDYFATVPGMSFAGNAAQGGSQFITLRGLATSDYQTPTVATIIDDVPIGNSLGLNYGSEAYPDVDPSDLSRIEVLKGPQGTLYGADSMGGVIKFNFKDPSTAGYSGNVQALGNYVDGGGPGYTVRGSVNVPISDTFAIRASAFSRRDGGYVDNLWTGQHDVNSDDVYGGHFAALWRPSENLSLKLSALVQDSKGDGAALINTDINMKPTLGSYDQTGILGDNSYYNRLRVYSGTLKATLGGVDFTSVTGYSSNGITGFNDSTGYNSGDALRLFGVTAATDGRFFTATKFTEELRAQSSIGKNLDWIVGGFYTHENTDGNIPLEAANATTGAPAGLLINFHDGPLKVSEYAVFADLTYHFTNQFDIQVGGRQSWDTIDFDETDTGPIVPEFDGGATSPNVFPHEHTTGDAFTYLVTPEYKFSSDVMAYARVATGYRLGGPNLANGANFGLPTSFAPDKTTNYEVGLKGSVLDRALTIDVSVYYIDWQSIQLSVYSPTANISYTVNGGKAKSEGLELQVEAHPTQTLTITAAGSVNDARLTQNLPANGNSYGLSGDRLPYSAPFTGSLSGEQEIFHINQITGIFGAIVSHIGGRELEFAYNATDPRFSLPGYTTGNLHFGVRYEGWYGNLFANNVGNTLGMTSGGYAHDLGNTHGYYASIIAPRTFGLSISKSF